MDFWIKAAQLILSLSILVVLHEFGHYIPARIFKTRVEKFYLFFNPWFSLFKKKVGDTEWGIGWLPLGGYVKIAGMVDESMDKEQLALPPQPWEFRSKPAWQRLIIMVGGVTVNLLLGIFIYICVMFFYGEEQIKPTDLKAGIAINPYLKKYNLQSGDNILAIDGEKITHINDINNRIMLRDGRKLSVVHADGSKEIITLPEGIDYELFQNGAFPCVGLRHKSISVDKITFSSPNKDLGIKVGDIISSVDGKKLNNLDLNEIKQKNIIKLKILRDDDPIELTLNSEQFKKALLCSPSLSAGLQEGDRFLEISNSKIEYFDNIVQELYNSTDKRVTTKILRNHDTLILTFAFDNTGKIGFAPKSLDFIDKNSIHTIHYGFGESVGKGIDRGFHTLSDYASQLKFIFTKKGASSIGGFGAIGNLFPSTWNWQIFWLNTALISIILAFMNILPIPALDGGHVVFLLYEIVTGREAPQKVLEVAQYAGFILLMGLLLYANGNDLYRYFFGG